MYLCVFYIYIGRSRYDWIEEYKGPGSETSEYKEARRVFYIEFDIYKEANPELFEAEAEVE